MKIEFKAIAGSAMLLAATILGPARAAIPQIQHVVIIFQENRTPDNLFQGLPSVLPTADIATSGQNSHGKTITLTPGPLATKFDLNHKHESWLAMYNGGLMNGADLIPCLPLGTTCPANPQFEYANPTDVAPYFSIAVNYGFANRMFQSNQGPSFPAHQFIISGTSQRSATSLLFAANNPLHHNVGSNGCDAPHKKTVEMVGPGGVTSRGHPCFEHETLTDLLDDKGLSWRYYTPSEGSIWTGPNAIRHMCQPSGSPPKCNGAPFNNGHIALNPAQVLTDIQQSKLKAVSWVIPTALESDHAGETDGTGPSWVASIVNTIGASPYWTNTVILITWDDWGGWYDHVVPPIDPTYGYYENGFRVPLLVVSAYTPAGYVSQQTHTFGSILKFVETAFTLPVIPPGNFADSRSDDLADFFNFSAPPRPFVTVPAPIPPAFFLHDTRPRMGPDND